MESIARVSAVVDAARDLTLEAAQSLSAARRSYPSNPTSSTSSRPMALPQLKKLLDSRSERDVLEGLRKTVSLLYTPSAQSTRSLFSSVIKNVAAPSLPVRKLVYIYLLHHAEAEPDLALLSINTIQKTLADTNPAVRALALKVMSGLKVPVISAIVVLAIKRGVGDMSPLVRRAAALAIPKCYKLDPSTKPQLVEHLSTLIGDRQYYVTGPAVAAFLEVCPEKIDIIHPHYRGLIRKLVDMDEWSQLATLRLMVSYARKCFPRRTKRIRKDGAVAKGFYGDEEEEDSHTAQQVEEVIDLDPDLRLLLDACKLLLQSRNTAVIVAVARCYLYLGTSEYIDISIGPLISLLRGPRDVCQVALHDVVLLCIDRPQLFVRYVTHFFVRATDSSHIWRLKLELLAILYPYCDAHMRGIILSELEHFSQGSDPELVQESVRAVGRCAQNDPDSSGRCMRLLVKQISSPDGNLVAESLTVIRHLIQQDPKSHAITVIRLAKKLDTITNPDARASIIWLVGEFAGLNGENNVAPDVLRILVKNFASESEVAKLQIVLLAAKTYVHHLNRSSEQQSGAGQRGDQVDKTNDWHDSQSPQPSSSAELGENTDSELGQLEEVHPMALLWTHVLLLARYDTSYDLRDRARLYKALFESPSSTQLASLMLLAPKPAPHTPSPSQGHGSLTLGSASLVIGGGSGRLRGYEDLPDWVAEDAQPDSRLREDSSQGEYGDKAAVTPAGDLLDRAARKKDESSAKSHTALSDSVNAVSYKEKSLDDWLAEDNDNGTDASDEESELASDEEYVTSSDDEQDGLVGHER